MANEGIGLYDRGHNTAAVVSNALQSCTFNNPIYNSYWKDYTWHIECAGYNLNWANNIDPLSFEGYSSDNNEQWRVIPACGCDEYWLINTAATITDGQNIFATSSGTGGGAQVFGDVEGQGNLAVWYFVV